jgi:nucleotide-binding universal stress UspA family protein
MMSAILLATDLSPHADRSLARAALLAMGDGQGLDVLHVVGRELMSGPQYEAALARAADALRDDLAEAELPDGLAVTQLPRGGEVGQAIVDAAKERGSRIVVLAAPHSDLLVQIFRASVLHRVVRHAPCPVLVVRRRARQAYRRIVVGVDLSLPSRRALETALRLLPGEAMAQASLTVVNARLASLPPAEAAEQLARVDDMLAASLGRLAAEGRPAPATEIVVEEGSPVDVVAKVAARSRAELVVVGTMGLTGAANLLLGSTAETLLATLPCDVMAVRPVEG